MKSLTRAIGLFVAATFLLALWQMIASFHTATLSVIWKVLGLRPPIPDWAYLSSPIDVANSFYVEVLTGRIFTVASDTTKHTIVALAISLFVGILGAEWLGRNRLIPNSFRPIAKLLNGIPPVTLLPVALVAFGLGSNSVIAIAAYGAILSVLFISMNGFELVSADLTVSMRQFGYSRFGAWLWKLSAAAPQLGTAAREGLRWALILAVVAEMHGATAGGLGAYIDSARLNQEYSKVYVGIISCGLLVVVLQFFLNRGSRLIHKALLRTLLGK